MAVEEIADGLKPLVDLLLCVDELLMITEEIELFALKNSGYQATGSVAGSLLQVILLVIGVAVYAPFVRLADRLDRKNTARNIDRLTAVFFF